MRHAFEDGEELIISYTELPHFIVDRYFDDESIRRDLQKKLPKIAAGTGRCAASSELISVKGLHCTCKNPECGAMLQTPLKDYLGQ